VKQDSVDVGGRLFLLTCWVCCPRILNTIACVKVNDATAFDCCNVIQFYLIFLFKIVPKPVWLIGQCLTVMYHCQLTLLAVSAVFLACFITDRTDKSAYCNSRTLSTGHRSDEW